MHGRQFGRQVRKRLQWGKKGAGSPNAMCNVIFVFSSACTHLDIKGVARLKSISGKDWREVIDWAQTEATNPGCTVPVGTLCCYRRTSPYLYSLAAFAGNTGSICHGFSVKRNRLRASLRTNNFFKPAPGKVQCSRESTSRSSFQDLASDTTIAPHIFFCRGKCKFSKVTNSS